LLYNIPRILSPDLLKILMEMGHGDEIVLADGNFPAASHAGRLVRADGHSGVEMLDAILTLFPLDSYVEHPVALMQVVPGDGVATPIWDEFAAVIKRHDPGFGSFAYVDRFEFYDRAKRAYAVVATGEPAQYANLILKKGIILQKGQ
jgi:L-fucose mutarotase